MGVERAWERFAELAGFVRRHYCRGKQTVHLQEGINGFRDAMCDINSIGINHVGKFNGKGFHDFGDTFVVMADPFCYSA